MHLEFSRQMINRRRRWWLAVVLIAVVFLMPGLARHAQAQTFFTDCITGPTGNNAIVTIPAGVPIAHTDAGVEFTPTDGDEFAVFAPEGAGSQICAGSAVWNAAGAALTVWGDNSQTLEIDGMRGDETMQWRAWDQSANVSYNVIVTYDDTSFPTFWPNGQYGTNRIYRLLVLQPTAVDLVRLEGASGFARASIAGGEFVLAMTLASLLVFGFKIRKG